MRVENWLSTATGQLKSAGIASARLDALILAEDCLHKDRSWLLAHPETSLTAAQLKKLKLQTKRRAVHEPLSYIRGFTEFYGRRFKINHRVLEPRPESETMIELLIKYAVPEAQSQRLSGVQGAGEQRTELYMKYSEGAAEPATTRSARSTSGAAGFAGRQADAVLTIADIGTGCGAIGITAALELRTCEVDLYDIDASALAVAKHNCALHELHLRAYKRDLLSRPARDYNVILANLPYIPNTWKINLAAGREPKTAIFGGADGLDLYRRLFSDLDKHSQSGQFVLTESLPPQHKKMAIIAKSHGFSLLKTEDFIQVFVKKGER